MSVHTQVSELRDGRESRANHAGIFSGHKKNFDALLFEGEMLQNLFSSLKDPKTVMCKKDFFLTPCPRPASPANIVIPSNLSNSALCTFFYVIYFRGQSVVSIIIFWNRGGKFSGS